MSYGIRRPMGSLESGTLPVLGVILAMATACGDDATQSTDDTTTTSGPTTTTLSGDTGSSTGVDESTGSGACAEDCSAIDVGPCMESVCNEGQHDGPVGECVEIPAPDATPCDDGLFCTLGDTCVEGACVGGADNTCGLRPVGCELVECNEGSRTCSMTPVENGEECTPESLCEENGVCQNGTCLAEIKDCADTTVTECEVAVCDPADGTCGAVADMSKNGTSCSDAADLCLVDTTCTDGVCGGGAPLDCSDLDDACAAGVCDDGTGTCVAQAVMDDTACNDFNACTTDDVCTAGVCGGTALADCDLYYEDGFESGCPPDGWTLAADWECGSPTVGPGACFDGTSCIGTVMAADYNVNQAYATTIAQTPPIDLASATQPALAYQHWIDTEGSSFDGYHVEVSTDGGVNWTVLSSVDPPYPLTINNAPAYGGHIQAWEQVVGDLSAYVGQQIQLRFAFRSDGSITYPGVFVDDVVVSELDAVPLMITTAGLPNAHDGIAYDVQMQRVGGTPGATWSIVGGTNIAWLSIDPMTGVLSGTPGPADVGPVNLTVRVEEPTNPTNFDEMVYDFAVTSVLVLVDFEGACPNGWTMTGDWQCGIPSGVGPASAASGTQCIGVVIDGEYNNDQPWGTATATAPAIDLPAGSPTAEFAIWIDTETSFDGAHLEISVDGGATYTVVDTVQPAYTVTLDNQPAWSGHHDALGWRTFYADLSSWAGQNVLLRFAFRSDASVTYPGIYIDDVLVAG